MLRAATAPTSREQLITEIALDVQAEHLAAQLEHRVAADHDAVA